MSFFCVKYALINQTIFAKRGFWLLVVVGDCCFIFFGCTILRCFYKINYKKLSSPSLPPLNHKWYEIHRFVSNNHLKICEIKICTKKFGDSSTLVNFFLCERKKKSTFFLWVWILKLHTESSTSIKSFWFLARRNIDSWNSVWSIVAWQFY